MTVIPSPFDELLVTVAFRSDVEALRPVDGGLLRKHATHFSTCGSITHVGEMPRVNYSHLVGWWTVV